MNAVAAPTAAPKAASLPWYAAAPGAAPTSAPAAADHTDSSAWLDRVWISLPRCAFAVTECTPGTADTVATSGSQPLPASISSRVIHSLARPA